MTSLPDQVRRDVVVIGGCGHVGLPLALAFADRGAQVGIYDVSEAAVASVNGGQLPFAEPGADEVLHRVLGAGRLVASADPAIVATAENVVVVIGTPVDEHLNPKQTAITRRTNRRTRPRMPVRRDAVLSGKVRWNSNAWALQEAIKPAPSPSKRARLGALVQRSMVKYVWGSRIVSASAMQSSVSQ